MIEDGPAYIIGVDFKVLPRTNDETANPRFDIDGGAMSEVRVDDHEPWYLRQREGEPSRHLQVWCGNAYLLVRKSDGLTEIGYKDDGGENLPLATDDEIGDWLQVLQWRSEQSFPWSGPA